MQRRQLLQLAASSAALLALPKTGWAKQKWFHDPFSLGIASGSPTSDSVVLWTRLGPQAIEAANLTHRATPVVWQVAHDESFSKVVAKGTVQAEPSLAHSVHAEVTGLAADRHYFYRFIAGDAVSQTGRTRTFPRPDSTPGRLRLAYASCQQWGNGYYSAYRHMLGEDLDVVMFLGDYMYEYPSSRPVDIRPTTGGWITTLEGYRSRYALHKSDRDLQAIHAAFPWIMTWDDHEVQNDYAGTRQGESGPPVADFMARRAAAYQAYYEHMPVRRADFAQIIGKSGENTRIFGATSYGRLANLYLLDDRQFRDPQVCTNGNRPGASRINPKDCEQLNQPWRTLLGQEQEGWLKRQFEHSQAQWNILGQQTLLGRRNFNTDGGVRLWNDGWDGYPAARQRLIDSMQSTRLSNPVVFGGDVHENWVGHILKDYEDQNSAKIGVEFCGTSITSLSHTSQNKIEQIRAVNPHFIFANAEYRGYGVAEFTAKSLTTTLKAVKDATDPGSDSFTLAQFTVQAGQPEILKIT